ncbi:hypothetical protein H5410_005713 [Solanum commersonii]|uniref:DUF7745 domain-containing protein n=1 Tax=Solanum commersonii TaxID=4109 RepID=A0A9J6A932_SOLCO|nr:hypothetical protein H5410_005713 [Solanum commersonii]
MPHLGSLITLMIEFWQPTTKVTFQFIDFEITPTLEEISQIVDLALVGRVPLAPRTTLGISFLQSLGLRVGQCLQRVDEEWVRLDYLFKRLGRRDSYDRFHQEFFISRVDWERLGAIVFMTAFLGIMIFPKKKGCDDINLLPMIIFMFRGPIRVTIVPMILAEIFRSLSLCSRGYDHFKRKNGDEVVLRNKIRSHAMRLSMWDAPNDEDGRISIERIAALVQGWCSILDSDIGVESWCTLKYYTWFIIGGILTRPNYEGIFGFTDT